MVLLRFKPGSPHSSLLRRIPLLDTLSLLHLPPVLLLQPHLSLSSNPSSADGVVVVGFISRSKDDASQLINRVLDDNVFGSGNLDTRLGGGEGLKDWFRFRKMSYYYEEERWVMFLHFVSAWDLYTEGLAEEETRLDSVVEDFEFGDFQGMLLMFS